MKSPSGGGANMTGTSAGASPGCGTAGAAAKRRGVANFSEVQDNLSRAFRRMLIPAQEVSRMGWAPLRESADDADGGDAVSKQVPAR